MTSSVGSTDPIVLPRSWAVLTEKVNHALDSYCQFKGGCPSRLQEAMRYSLLGPGKRLRPLLALFAAEAVGGDPLQAMPAACAVEMVHAYSLIHDDLPCMDDDELRRGRPTCHVKYGESTAILAGDALLARAFEILATDISPGEVASACCRELAVAAGPCNLVGGQSDDLNGDRDASTALLLAIHRRKTGALFLAPLRMGAIVATGNCVPPPAIDRYGTSLGLAFQIVDDLLDSEGNQATVGKATGKDHGRGKLTFPGLLGVEESRRRATALVAEACEAVESFGDSKERLVALARFVLDRNR